MVFLIILVAFATIMALHMYFVKSAKSDSNGRTEDGEAGGEGLHSSSPDVNFHSKAINIRPWMVGSAILTICIFLVVQPFRIKIVPDDETGIQYTWWSLFDGDCRKISLCSGTVIYNHLASDIFTYPKREQRCCYGSILLHFKDSTFCLIDSVGLSYSIREDKAEDVFRHYGASLTAIAGGCIRMSLEDVLARTEKSFTMRVLRAYPEMLEKICKADLEQELAKKGITLRKLTITVGSPARPGGDSISCDTLKGDGGRSLIRQARMEAEAMRIRALAEAEYNRIIAASLSPLLIKKKWIDKWDGRLCPGQNMNDVLPKASK